MIAAILVLAGLEWARLCKLTGATAAIYAVALGGVFVAVGLTGSEWPLFALAALFWAIVAPAWLWRGVRREEQARLATAGFVVLVPAGLAMLALAPWQVLLVLVLVWIADTAAYFTGRAWGRRKLAPAISPGKTWEGAAGGLIGVLAYAIIAGSFLPGIARAPFVALAVMLAILSIIGDLFESAAKRQAGVKDSGHLLPGHGGVLDRIDSASAVLPLAALLWPLVEASS